MTETDALAYISAHNQAINTMKCIGKDMFINFVYLASPLFRIQIYLKILTGGKICTRPKRLTYPKWLFSESIALSISQCEGLTLQAFCIQNFSNIAACSICVFLGSRFYGLFGFLTVAVEKLTDMVCHGGVSHGIFFTCVCRMEKCVEMPVIDPESPFS